MSVNTDFYKKCVTAKETLKQESKKLFEEGIDPQKLANIVDRTYGGYAGKKIREWGKKGEGTIVPIALPQPFVQAVHTFNDACQAMCESTIFKEYSIAQQNLEKLNEK